MRTLLVSRQCDFSLIFTSIYRITRWKFSRSSRVHGFSRRKSRLDGSWSKDFFEILENLLENCEIYNKSILNKIKFCYFNRRLWNNYTEELCYTNLLQPATWWWWTALTWQMRYWQNIPLGIANPADITVLGTTAVIQSGTRDFG